MTACTRPCSPGEVMGDAYETPLPNRVFYQDGVACYATLQIGECDQIHVMADPAQLDQWRAAGVEVTEGFPAGGAMSCPGLG